MKQKTDTVTQILDIALRLVQERGYNAFSYGHIAEEIGIRRAAIHYHFPSKDDLGRELVIYYRKHCTQMFEQIDRETSDPLEKLKKFIGLDAHLLDLGRVCLGGVLAAEIATLPAAVVAEVNTFFAETEKWIAQNLTAGHEAGQFRTFEQPLAAARSFLAGVQGALLLARSNEAPQAYFGETTQYLLQTLAP